MKIACIFGTRPEIIKFASIIKEAKRLGEEMLLIHTGQHYDYNMSDSFLRDLALPSPNYNLGVGSGTRCEQIAKTMVLLEPVLAKEKPDVVLVQGDTNIVTAAALTARHMMIPVGHVEAGLRSFNELSAEEISRKVTASLAMLHFAPTELNKSLLAAEGVPEDRIFVTGNTVIDSVKYIEGKDDWKKLRELTPSESGKKLVIATVHRATNSDDPGRLFSIFSALSLLDKYEVVFPMHPRTRKNAEKFGIMQLLSKPNIHVLDPMDYVRFLAILNASSLIITDSGGVQEEATELLKPVITIREETPRWESVILGVNTLVGVETKSILDAVERVMGDSELPSKLSRAHGIYGDGKAGERILKILRELQKSGKLKHSPPSFGIPGIVWNKFTGL